MIGNKAKSLMDLQKIGMTVPPFFVLDTSHFMAAKENQNSIPGLTEGFIETEMARFPEVKSWAVRSSCIKEDGPTTSFAGLFESFLDLRLSNDVHQAVTDCWKSVESDRVRTYSERNKLSQEELKMAVVIQEFIEPDLAGVLFTAHPTSGADQEMLLEYCEGRGENLVSGHITPSRVRVNWSGDLDVREHLVNQKAILKNDLILQLRRMGQEVQAYYGKPQDIEFAIKGNRIYLVQSRDITKLQFSPEMGEWTTADFRDGGVSSEVVSPLMWSLYDKIFSTSLPGYFHKLKLLSKDQVEQTQWYKVFYGRPYWNLRAVKNMMKEVPGFNERNFDQDMSIPATYPGDGETTPMSFLKIAKAIPTVVALGKEFEKQKLRSEDLLKNFSNLESKYKNLNLLQLSSQEFSKKFHELIHEDYTYVESEYFQTIYNASNAKLEFLNDLNFYRKINPKLEYVHLISDLGEIAATRPPFELADLAARHKSAENEKLLSELLQSKTVMNLQDINKIPGALGIGLKAFIEKYYFHSERELDLRVPRWIENPRFIIATLKATMSAAHVATSKELAQHKSDTYQAAMTLMKQCHDQSKKRWIPGQWSAAEKNLKRVRHYLWLREELRDLSTRMYHFIRCFARELARRQNLGDAVFYSSYQDLLELASGKMRPRVLEKKALELKNYAEGYRNYRNPNEIGYRYNSVGSQATPFLVGTKGSFIGIGCSAGRVRATARVLSSISESERLQPGDILVAKFTDPGWTPLFGLISGVVCEYGGLLSHAALISREYGIPSVLNVTDATRNIKDGQEIEICGTSGEVHLL